MSILPHSHPLLRPTLPRILTLTQILAPQTRHASLLRRPKRPYTFTQLVTLSDGSTYTQRTTSPQPVYKSTKDTRNSPLWNPSSQRLLNVETDDAGRLRAFRDRFGRGWDAKAVGEVGGTEDEDGDGDDGGEEGEEEEDSLLDLIGGYREGKVVEGGKGGKDKGKES